LAVTPIVNPVRSDNEIETAIAAAAYQRGAGVVVMADSFMAVHRATVIEQAARHRVPAVYPFRSATAERRIANSGAYSI
jgi:putative ABC transport system substrate-binding protein